MQAVCTEFLITYCDLLFCEDLPRFADLNFDLGIEVGCGDDRDNEVDIDGAIRRAEKEKQKHSNVEEEVGTDVDSSTKRQIELEKVLLTVFCEVPLLALSAGRRAAGLVHQWNCEKTVSKPHCTLHFVS